MPEILPSHRKCSISQCCSSSWWHKWCWCQNGEDEVIQREMQPCSCCKGSLQVYSVTISEKREKCRKTIDRSAWRNSRHTAKELVVTSEVLVAGITHGKMLEKLTWPDIEFFPHCPIHVHCLPSVPPNTPRNWLKTPNSHSFSLTQRTIQYATLQ